MTSVVACLVELTLAASVAVLLVGLLRAPLRRIAGARAAYGLWLMVPLSSLTLLLPAPPHPLAPLDMAPSLADGSGPVNDEAIALAVWGAGVLVMLAVAVARQRAFVRSLGSLLQLPNGTYKSASAIEPMVIGALRPRVVLPADFEARYTRDERALVLAHEQAHVKRGDALTNALATVWLCLSWFNPLMHWAIGWFRFDQELACDALVLAATGTARRRYADALLKTQLAAQSIAAVPAGCHWQSTHPLTQRIAALKRPLPGIGRRWFGAVLVLTFISTGCYAAWAIRPDLQPAESDAARTIAGQVSQALLMLPAAREIALEPVGQLLQSATPARKTPPRRCKLSRAKARTTS